MPRSVHLRQSCPSQAPVCSTSWPISVLAVPSWRKRRGRLRLRRGSYLGAERLIPRWRSAATASPSPRSGARGAEACGPGFSADRLGGQGWDGAQPRRSGLAAAGQDGVGTLQSHRVAGGSGPAMLRGGGGRARAEVVAVGEATGVRWLRLREQRAAVSPGAVAPSVLSRCHGSGHSGATLGSVLSRVAPYSERLREQLRRLRIHTHFRLSSDFVTLI